MRNYNNHCFKYQNPKLELMYPKKNYAITINSREAFPVLKMWASHYCQLLMDSIVKYAFKIELFPELSPTGRLHYHGTIQFKSYSHILNHYTAGNDHDLNIMIKPIISKKEWTTYMSKQQQFWKALPKKKQLSVLNLSKIRNLAKPVSNKQVLQYSVLDHLIERN